MLALLAAPPSQARPSTPEAAPRPEWLVGKVRFEPLAPDGFLTASDLGDYRGALELVRSGGGLAVVNDVAVEDYVRGIAEVPSSWPMEALRAQAIAARTYALNQKNDPPPSASGVGADICPTQACQVYVGLAKERDEGGQRWVSAVESTRGQVLLRKGAPIRAMYYAGAVPGTGGPAPAPPKQAPSTPPKPVAPTPAPAQPQPATPPPSPPPLLGILPGGPPPPAPPPPPPPTPAPGPAPAGPAPKAPAPAGPQVPQGPVIRGHGIGMSQYGALAKAERGARASSILASYYGGARPSRLPANRTPATIRVALDTGRSAVSVAGPGRFRILDEAGRSLAVVATGEWRVLPGPQGKLRVLPPAGQEAPPAIEALGTVSAELLSGGPALLHIRLSAPALVHVSVDVAGGAETPPTPPQLLEAGEAAVPLPPLPQPGPKAVSLVAVSGVHRVSTAPVDVSVLPLSKPPGLQVAARQAAVPERPRPGPVPVLPAAMAFVLLLCVTTGTVVAGFAPRPR